MTEATAYAPANIALSKYWGKRDKALNLPCNGSLSISLGELGTTTTVREAETNQLRLNGNLLSPDSGFARKVWAFVDFFQPDRTQSLLIETTNTIPTAAGLASSASGFAALTLALNTFFARQYSERDLSILARQGSGSACRSLWHGFVLWQKGERVDGLDSYATPMASDWRDLRIAVIDVNTATKKTASRDGMNHTARTSPLFSRWTAQAERDLSTISQAIESRDFQTLGETAEANAMMMHATMFAARPALCYWQEESLTALRHVWQLREEGLMIYATMDAGPNVKLLFQAEDQSNIRAQFPDALQINPFQDGPASF